MSLFSGRAKGIEFNSDADFFEAIGYLAKPGVLKHFEAQVPDEKVAQFEVEFPNQTSYSISTENLTSGGNVMKTGVQLRIYLGHTSNIPRSLKPHIVKGNRINRGLFAEKLMSDFGFDIGFGQNPAKIRRIVQTNHPTYLTDFDRGFSL